VAIERRYEASCDGLMKTRTLRIGGGCGFWGDSADGPAQLVRRGNIDVLVLDYLSEITMSLLARARQKRPELGYATDFATAVMEPLGREIADRKIKVVTNAGGVHPQGCRDALAAIFKRIGVDLTIAVVSGDDITSQVDALRARGVRDLETGGPLPRGLASANAYLGAFPIADALTRGADIVITGRAADSALALAPLISTFGWRAADLDSLALGSLVGHILECGPQACGGIHTDWRAVADGWDDMGYPIVEYDGGTSFVVTKPAGTGGIVSASTVAEQVTYEIHDPGAYILPDIVCDLRDVRLEDLGSDRVRVSGARGLPPTSSYKACLTYHEGFRCTATVMIVGRDAVARAEHVGNAILRRTRRLFHERGWSDYRASSLEVLGAEAMYGPHARARDTREVILKIAVAHEAKEPLELFSREIAPAVTAMAQGLTGIAAGRPSVQPIVRLASCLIPKDDVDVEVEVAGQTSSYSAPLVQTEARARAPTPAMASSFDETGPLTEVPLIRLAYGRSGDKGDLSNVSVLARRPEFIPLLGKRLTPAVVRAYLGHLVDGEVERFDWPGLNGWNFVLHQALGGGGIASLRYDPQGKSFAQLLMDLPIAVPTAWLRQGGLLDPASTI
jgi:hypothetical protein